MLDWSFFGAHPSGHHFVSLLLHIGASVLLFLFLNKTTQHIWTSAFAAAFFALHPLRVESVAWASERKDVLSMFFGMASLYVYAFYAKSSQKSYYYLCLTFFALSLLSKSMLVTLPFVFLLMDYWPLGRWSKNTNAPNPLQPVRKLLTEKIPFLILAIIFSIITIWAQYGDDVIRQPFTTRMANSIVAYTIYLRKTFWPDDLALFYFSAYTFPGWQILISGLLLTGITIVAMYSIRTKPFLLVGWFWYLGTLIPVIGWVPTSALIADHYTYLPSIGIAMMLAWGVSSMMQHEKTKQKLLCPSAVVLMIMLMILTSNQSGYWKNNVTLFSHALRVTSNNVLAHNNLGDALFEDGKTKEAIDHYSEAIRIKPKYFSYYNNRASSYARLGQYQLAIDDYNKSIQLKPDCMRCLYNRGCTYLESGQYHLAIEDFNNAIRLVPDYVSAHYNKGIACAKLGRNDQAIENFSKAIGFNPNYALAYYSRGLAYILQGNYKNACLDARKLCELGNCQMLEFAKSHGHCF